ncbi:cysteine desulfurase family protein [Gilvimarinus polysaccharolyticus]|uniref:cysteine desulfurase family protein n=1 Tax=Gilvimarinus polysaccharolyticus TaxID=863921 RepID=UPI0006737872|nr:aminotransferase class V-fold PLP-dependent enzyme [Gilvimarinus polysaccharolyticus]
MTPIYLDYAATTPVAPEVAEAMAQCLTLDGNFANPASRSHRYGWQAEEAVETARGQIAELIGADAREIVWTSGATESNNLALKGVFESAGKDVGHLAVSAIEHKSVLDPAQWLAEQGHELSLIAPDSSGRITAQAVASVLRSNTRLVSVMLVNNELGTINPIAEIAQLCREHGCLLHVDAAQALGKMPVNVTELGADLLSLSAHKFYGPKGVGALYVRRSPALKLAAQIHGGGHERGMRSGTLATHQCVGFGVAADLARAELERGSEQKNSPEQVAQLRDRLWAGIAGLPGVRVNGHPSARACGHLSVTFGELDGELLLLSLRELALSTGSACTSASMAPSYVLKAIGLSDAEALATLRISLGRYTTEHEVERTIAHINTVVGKLTAKVS